MASIFTMASKFTIPIYSAKYTPTMNNYIHQVVEQIFNAEHLLPHYQNIQRGTLVIPEQYIPRQLELIINLLEDHAIKGDTINTEDNYKTYARNSNVINQAIEELNIQLGDINQLNAISIISSLSKLPTLPKYEDIYKTKEYSSRKKVKKEEERQSIVDLQKKEDTKEKIIVKNVN